MILLDKRLLGGTHGIAEEERDFMVSGFIVFKGKDVGELSAVITQESIEQRGNGNARMTQKGLQGGKAGGSFGGGLGIHKQADHEVAGSEMDRHDDLSADTSDHRIQFHMPFETVFFDISEEVVVGTSDFHTGRDVIFTARLPRLELDGSGKVDHRSGEIALPKIPIHGTLGAGDLRMRGHDLIDVLAVLQILRDDTVVFVELFLRQRDTLTCTRQQLPVFILCGSCAIVVTGKMTGGRRPLLASVAHERSLQQERTHVIVRDEAVAVFHPMVLDLIGNGCGILFDQLPDCLERHPLAQALLDFPPVFRLQVFVLLRILFLDHDVVSFPGFLPRLNSTTFFVSG